MVGAAAMRQVAEEASAQSAVKEEWVEPISYFRDMWQTSSLRSAAEEVAKKFPEKEQQQLTEAVMKAYQNGELDKGLKEMSWEEKQRYLLTTMQTMREEYLRSAAEEVAKKNFPKKEREKLTEAVMEAFKNGELDTQAMFYDKYLLRTMNRLRELPVAASAVKFCSNLFREAAQVMDGAVEAGLAAKVEVAKVGLAFERLQAAKAAQHEAQEARGICHKVLTGELGADDGPEWAEKAANSSQPEGQHYQLGRLQMVNATEKAWKVSLKNVCKDECIELVKEMKKETREILNDVGNPSKPPSYEEVCAKRVVQKVEAEILGCCAESCGWNGRACMLWPFLNSTEKGEWEAECCTEFNILKNSSRATMCDATLTGQENNEVIRDPQPNSKKDRRMIGQDPVLKGTSFLQEEDTNGPTPPPENTPIPRHEGECQPPLDLAKVHAKLKDEWKTIELPSARFEKFKNPGCGGKEPTPLIEECTAFLPRTVNGPYVCFEECLESGSLTERDPDLKTLDAESTGNTGLLYVHETIYRR